MTLVRVQLVDPPAYTPPYDHALAAALARAGADVELLTSRWPYGAAPAQGGYAVREDFYRRATADGRGTGARRALRLAEHVPGHAGRAPRRRRLRRRALPVAHARAAGPAAAGARRRRAC